MPISFANATLVDALVLVLIGLYILEDVRNGILYGLVQLAGLLVSLLAALLFYSAAANGLMQLVGLLRDLASALPSDWTTSREVLGGIGLGYGLAKPLAFGGVWLLSDLLYGTTVRRITALPSRDVARSQVGRLLGAVTGLARGVVVATLLLAIVAALPLPDPVTGAVADSRVGSRLAVRGENVQRALGGVLGDRVVDVVERARDAALDPDALGPPDHRRLRPSRPEDDANARRRRLRNRHAREPGGAGDQRDEHGTALRGDARSHRVPPWRFPVLGRRVGEFWWGSWIRACRGREPAEMLTEPWPSRPGMGLDWTSSVAGDPSGPRRSRPSERVGAGTTTFRW